MSIPAITTDQKREVDRLMIEDYGIELIQMMENAGRHLAMLACQRFLANDPVDKRMLVLAGSGGNGGGGLVAARRLQNWGAQVHVYLTKTKQHFKGIPAHQLAILKRMKVPVEVANENTKIPDADLILDAIIGYSLRRAPWGMAAHLIQMANMSGLPILSLDIPSGVDATTGQVHDPHIRADATLTLALPKTGLFQETVKPYIGELYLADIGVPPQLYAALNLEVGPIFSSGEILHV
jgi:NAD(P)H-hydrate epimerase